MNIPANVTWDWLDGHSPIPLTTLLLSIKPKHEHAPEMKRNETLKHEKKHF